MFSYRQLIIALGFTLSTGLALAEMPDREELEAALEACASSLEADSDGRPDMSAMESCMSAKGFSRPSGPPGHGEHGSRPGNPPSGRGE
jgi:hypothetical protein